MPVEILEFSSNDEKMKWDEFVVKHPDGVFTQLSTWGRVKALSGWESHLFVIQQAGDIAAGMNVFRRPMPFGLCVTYVPYGPLALNGREELVEQLLKELQRQGHRAVAVKLEPRVGLKSKIVEMLKESGFSESTHRLQSESTLLLDLGKSEEELLADMRQTTRRYIRQAEKAGLNVTENTTLDKVGEFYRILEGVNNRKRFGIHSLAYYQKIVEEFRHDARLFFVDLNGEILGSYLLLQSGFKAWELYGGVTETGSKAKANYLLKWRSIQMMKAAGVATYDQWGVAPLKRQPESGVLPLEIQSANNQSAVQDLMVPGHPLAGVTYFKEGFGGQRVEWAGCWDWSARPFLFNLAKISKKL